MHLRYVTSSGNEAHLKLTQRHGRFTVTLLRESHQNSITFEISGNLAATCCQEIAASLHA